MTFKKGVVVKGVKPETVRAMLTAEVIYASYGYSLVVTSCLEGKHKEGSLHYSGYAVDLRTMSIPPDKLKEMKGALMIALGVEYDVVLEKDHFHIEYDPR